MVAGEGNRFSFCTIVHIATFFANEQGKEAFSGYHVH
jgi:hypothetical protein